MFKWWFLHISRFQVFGIFLLGLLYPIPIAPQGMMAPEAPLVALRMRPVQHYGVTENWAELVVETVAG